MSIVFDDQPDNTPENRPVYQHLDRYVNPKDIVVTSDTNSGHQIYSKGIRFVLEDIPIVDLATGEFMGEIEELMLLVESFNPVTGEHLQHLMPFSQTIWKAEE